MTFANADAAEFWAGMASTWRELEDRLDEVAGPPGRWAMERLGLGSGQRVLDVGCGTGITTVALAGLVGPDGRVVGLDIADEMLQAARERAVRDGVGNVEFVHGDAQVHDFGGAAFDAAFSRFGVMFFADPVAAFTNIHRGLRPGARLSFVCWQSSVQNEWMLVPTAAALAALGATPPVPDPDAPGPFAFAEPHRVRAILQKAGFGSVDIDPRNDFVVTAEDQIPDVVRTSAKVGMVRELLREADGETEQRVLAAMEDAMRARLDGGQVRAALGVNLVSAVA